MSRTPVTRARAPRTGRPWIVVPLLALLATALPAATPLELVVQPAPGRSAATLAPLAAYLGAAIGRPLRVVVHANVLAHWRDVRRASDAPRLIVDDAHFTDYRVHRLGYRVLAGVRGTVAFALLARKGVVLLSPDELAGRRVAAPPPPSLGAGRLLQIAPTGLRAPELVAAPTAERAVALVRAGEVVAALVPEEAAARYPDLHVVLLTEDTPAMGVSASPRVDAATADAVTRALLAAGGSRAGRRALEVAGLPGFRPASAELYDGYARLLRGTWDY